MYLISAFSLLLSVSHFSHLSSFLPPSHPLFTFSNQRFPPPFRLILVIPFSLPLPLTLPLPLYTSPSFSPSSGTRARAATKCGPRHPGPYTPPQAESTSRWPPTRQPLAGDPESKNVPFGKISSLNSSNSQVSMRRRVDRRWYLDWGME